MSISTKIVFLVFLLLCCADIFGAIDTNYIKKYDRQLSAKVYGGMSTKFIMVSDDMFEDADANGNAVTYQSNMPMLIGIGVAFDRLAISFGYGVPGLFDDETGEAAGFDLQTSFFRPRVALDVFAQYYSGFFNERTIGDGVAEIVARPDMSVFKAGVYGQYIFNADKFSYRSSFTSTEVQRKSAGSLLLGGSVFYNAFYHEDAIYSNDTNGSKTLYNIQFGPSAGYGYTAVFWKNYYASIAPTMGINLDFRKIDNHNYDKISGVPFAYVRFAFGYNSDAWSLLVTTVYQQYLFFNTDKVAMQFADLNARLTFIKRFHYENKTLSKLSKKITFQRSPDNW